MENGSGNAEIGKKEGEKLRRWEGERVEVGSRKAAGGKDRKWEVGMRKSEG